MPSSQDTISSTFRPFESVNTISIRSLTAEERGKQSFIWEKETEPFQSFICGWNALRPSKGCFRFSLSIKMKDEWSPWLPYALWEADGQRSFEQETGLIRLYQDTVDIAEGRQAHGWRMKLQAEETPNLKECCTLYASTAPLGQTKTSNTEEMASICLDIKGLSQLVLRDPRKMRLCSPTSTAAVIHFLKNETHLSPLEFADKVWDHHFDIYGHWVFAAAQAYVELGPEWQTTVQYLQDFSEIHAHLQAGYPVVVSVKGPLKGALHAYQQGHLLVVRGYDAEQKKVLCMDPGYPENNQTLVGYDLRDFLQAWQRRKNIAYTFKRHFINHAVT
jgi:hypothetical protein